MVPETRAIDPAEGARVADPRAVRVSVGEDGVGVGGDEPDVPAIVVEPAQTLMPQAVTRHMRYADRAKRRRAVVLLEEWDPDRYLR